MKRKAEKVQGTICVGAPTWYAGMSPVSFSLPTCLHRFRVEGDGISAQKASTQFSGGRMRAVLTKNDVDGLGPPKTRPHVGVGGRPASRP